MKNSLLSFLIILALCSSCGRYRFGYGYIERPCVYVPYAEGDASGLFTSQLIHHISTKGAFQYSTQAPRYCLQVCLYEVEDENIGFRFAPNSEGENTHILAAEEGRLTLQATVSVIEVETGEMCVGPLDIAASTTYDFEPDFTDVNLHQFSLSELEMHALAKETTYPSLYSILAEKIVDSLACQLMR